MIDVNDQLHSAHSLTNDTQEFFSADSPLKNAAAFGGRPYEFRPQQSQMANEVAFALQNNLNLCVEAPTGVGKSFAYLVPAFYYSLKKEEPVLITTETINLQEQLVEKDIPLLQEVMGLKRTVALAKGRSNYVCLKRYHLAIDSAPENFFPLSTDPVTLDRLRDWVSRTEDGTKTTVDFQLEPQVWDAVNCEVGNCPGPKCSHFRSCHYWNARKEWERADIIIANHALFFTDLSMRQDDEFDASLLPPYSALIFDEAHTLEDCASSHLGLHLSSAGVRYFLKRLFDPKSGRGMLVRKGSESMEMRALVAEVHRTTQRFFNALSGCISGDDSQLRVKRPNIVPDMLSEQLYKLKRQLTEYKELQDDDDFGSEIDAQLKRCEGLSQSIHDFLEMTDPEHIYWIENNTDTEHTTLHSAPLKVNAILQRLLFEAETPVVLTSATLTVNNTFDYYRSRIGFCHGREIRLDSPFNYHSQAYLYLPHHMPPPDDSNYNFALSEHIKHYINVTHGKAFVLFTSYSQLQTTAELLRDFFEDKGLTLLVQGEHLSRSAMIQQFKEDINSVIFGTTSFWTGVDVPGEALCNVIITKLPFSVPSHPLTEARIEALEESGTNAFMNYTLPEAVLKFRQGVGRLIRSSKDKGIIVLLDKRVLTKRYGNHFINSLPPCPQG